VTPGDGISACVVCQSPPLDEALIVDPDTIPPLDIRLSVVDHGGVTCRRLETMALRQTGEILRRPTVGKPCL
jgi:hypothetical protein